MESEIVKNLKIIEKRHGVKILFAVENGSRTWGVSSKDSDLDVRFVFARNVKDYLKINRLPEVIDINKANEIIDYAVLQEQVYKILMPKK